MAKVLVIHHEPAVTVPLGRALATEGHEVEVARDGAEAVAALASSPPDVVVLDVTGAAFDGWAVLRRLKARPGPGAAVPVVALVGDDPQERARAGIEGAVGRVPARAGPEAVAAAVALVLAGGPEADQRRRARHEALEELARTEKGAAGPPPVPAARPRLTRLERVRAEPVATPAGRAARDVVDQLSAKQRELLDVLAHAVSVSEAADELSVSRSNVYASLRRISRKLGIRTVPELLDLVRHGDLLGPEPPL